GWIWSGDVESRWATLAAHVPVGLNYSLSVTPFWGTDTGGVLSARGLTRGLYVGWVLFFAFNPLFRSHGPTSPLRLPLWRCACHGGGTRARPGQSKRGT